MQFLHHREYMEVGAVVVVDCDHKCNVQVMGDADFAALRSGRRYSYHGGFYRRLPARVAMPHSGWWNVTSTWPAVRRQFATASACSAPSNGQSPTEPDTRPTSQPPSGTRHLYKAEIRSTSAGSSGPQATWPRPA
ncbi:DUF1883 domain-containing protein [Falsiroseomonas tokyonensis]|uniref:DUF1883 domain-containing protein n=1 Tax=Falsiroseomonas tokyonensis TaxID=430521 RepID=A0ABV7C634_9PROT|nr:DUF1883 domain-containing protein [Falsiroseomonas tokyonensis]